MTGAVAPLRLRGRLRRNERGFLLEIDDGPIWRLTGAEEFAPLLADTDIIVEGRKAGSGLLDVLWMGPA